MSKISSIFLKGLIAFFPVLLTVYLIAWITTRLDSIFSDPLKSVLPEAMSFPGIGLLLVLGLIFCVGLAVNSLSMQPFVRWIDAHIQKLPVISSIYNPLRDVTQLFATRTAETDRRRLSWSNCRGWAALKRLDS